MRVQMTQTQPAEYDTDALAAILASKCQPGVLESLIASDNTAQKTERLIDFMEYEGRGAWQPEPFLELLCTKLEAVAEGKIKRLMVFMPPRSGKEIADTTQILTPDGWTTHGELKVGDYVFHPDGQAVEVLEIATEKHIDDYVVSFSNGESIRCHENHEWEVYDRPSKEWRILETKQILKRKLTSGEMGKRGGRYLFQVRSIAPLEFPSACLPIDPYFLGIWLGDGTRANTSINYQSCDEPMINEILYRGFTPTSRYVHPGTGVLRISFGGQNIIQTLRGMGCSPNKHIPEIYLHSSIEQRLDLLAGLIDSDGCVERKTGRVHISTGDKPLADSIVKLVIGFGFRPSVCSQEPCLSSSGIQGRKTIYCIGFQPDMDIPTQLSRKRILVFAKKRRIAITEIEYKPTGETGQCIQVDSPDGLYLVGQRLIPTHNSQVCSKKFPAWYLRKYPDREIMITSYSADLAFDFSRIARNTIQDERGIFPNINVNQQARAVKHWTLANHLGGLIAAGVGGPITGRGAHLAIIDDAFKNYEEAASETVRESVWQWYRSTLRTRLAPDGAIFLVCTRWHMDDLAGRLLEEAKTGNGEQWEVISLPGIAEENDQLGRKPGEALSSRFPIEELLIIKKAMGSYLFSSLYQQSPRAKEGNYFKAHWFIDSGDTNILLEKWREYDRFVPIYATMDFAIGQKQQNDWNVIHVAAISPTGQNVLIDRVRFKDDADGIADEIVNVQKKYKPLLFGFEEGQIRKAIWPTVQRKMKEAHVAINSQFMVPIGDKIARARTAQGQMRQNQWLFPFQLEWFEDFKEWLLGFPNATFDDDVDAFAYLALLISDNGGFFSESDFS